MDNKQLVERIIKGDMEAFSEMVDVYQNVLYSAAFNVLGDFHMAQDIAQEAFIKAYMHMAALKKPERLASWLYSIASRLSLNALRSRRQIDTLEDHTWLADSASLEENVERMNDRQLVWKALSTLDPSNRSSVILHYFGGLSMVEIGRILDASPSAIESRIRRSRKQLKKELLKTMEEVFENERLGTVFKQSVLNKIVTKAPFILAGYRIEAPFPELGKHVRASVRKIYDHLPALPDHMNKDIICLIPPQALNPQRPMLFVGMEIPGDIRLPEGMEKVSIPERRFALSTFKGTLDQYDEFHRSIPGVITEEGYVPMDMWQGYCFELYPENTYNWADDDAIQEIRLYWPIK
ncbi:sigma-70 family RNA polymerase sigma factor [Marinicrinis lubricantis]|uniref:RNA polymerase sigma factor n=1 Tax=Marinicrinis lubricantis TaxID=2086470 RepID=A0ABW1IKK7_9BACL